MKQRTVLDNTCHEVTFRISVLLCNTFLYYINIRIMYTVQYVHINLLKPSDYVMHQQFNIQQLYALLTLYLCVLYLSENKQRLVPLTA